MKIRNFAIVAATAAMVLLPQTSSADQLQDILSAGKIRIGVIMDAAPWGFVDENGEPAGIDIALANFMASDMGVELEMVTVTGANRIPSLMANKVDVLISAMGSNPERATQISFSAPYVAVDLGVYGPSSVGFTERLGDLSGYSIGVAKGSTLDLSMTTTNPNGSYNRFDDAAPTVAAYLAGQVDLIAENSAIIATVARDNPDKEFTLLYRIRQSPAHVGVRHGEQNLLNWVNTFLFFNRMNGRLLAIQKKWFGQASLLPHM